MAVRKGEAPRRIPAEVRFKGAAERANFKLVFRNVTGSEYRDLASRLTLGALLVDLVESWDCDYPLSTEGFEQLEDERPGVCEGLLAAWHRARRLELEGN